MEATTKQQRKKKNNKNNNLILNCTTTIAATTDEHQQSINLFNKKAIRHSTFINDFLIIYPPKAPTTITTTK